MEQNLPDSYFRKVESFVQGWKSGRCAVAYISTPHKKDRLLTAPGLKKTISEWKSIKNRLFRNLFIAKRLNSVKSL